LEDGSSKLANENTKHGTDLHVYYRIYKGVASKTAQHGYRADVREEAVARVSALRRSQQPKKDTPASKPRGARKAAAEASE
jgi:large subunit ribosomal protein L28e